MDNYYGHKWRVIGRVCKCIIPTSSPNFDCGISGGSTVFFNLLWREPWKNSILFIPLTLPSMEEIMQELKQDEIDEVNGGGVVVVVAVVALAIAVGVGIYNGYKDAEAAEAAKKQKK
jgi:lactobin A/cerein 7B family class IIb bacteriocin